MSHFRFALIFTAATGLVAVSQTAQADQSMVMLGKAIASSPDLTTAGAPKRRDGYWELTAIGPGGTAIGKKFLCVGSGSEEKFSLFDQLALLGSCSKKEFRRTAGGWSFETQCAMMDVTTTQKGTISGDFQNSFRVDQKVSQSSGFDTTGAMIGRRVGDCPAQYKPGDMVTEDGSMSINMLD